MTILPRLEVSSTLGKFKMNCFEDRCLCARTLSLVSLITLLLGYGSSAAAQYQTGPSYYQRPGAAYVTPGGAYAPKRYSPPKKAYSPPRVNEAPNPIYISPSATSTPATKDKAVTPEEAQRLYNRPKTNPPPEFDPKSPWPRIAGEFEKQNAILISVSELLPQHGKVFKRVAELTEGHVPLVVLFNDTKQVREAVKALEGSKQELKHLSFMKFELDTVWLRDFGPVLAGNEDGSVMSVDFFYSGQRPTDDHFPRDWAKVIGAEHNSVPWTIQGGNLLCNGVGLALTTTRIFDDNKVQFKKKPGVDPVKEEQKFVLDEFKSYTNLKHIEVLQPLANEKTKHVDMFATFIGETDVVVAKVDPGVDPVNARILDYNARRLAGIRIGGKSMKVHRVPVPPRRGTSWSPYTNVIIANRLLMVPVMQGDDRATMMEALNVYRRALPNHRVATVDITSMAKLEGALHCMSIHVPSYVELPEDKLVSFPRAKRWANKKPAPSDK